MAEELLDALANPRNRAILHLLAMEPAYPRQVATMLSLAETDVSRRLRSMEELGLVQSEWSYIGKNVKLYHLIRDRIDLEVSPWGLRVAMGETGTGPDRYVLPDPLRPHIPDPGEVVGREDELALLGDDDPVVLVTGLAGVGKTTLLARFARDRPPATPLFWHGFRGVESLRWLANRLALFLARHGFPDLLDALQGDHELADLHALLLEGLDHPGVVVVLDDLHRLEDEHVGRFLLDATGRVRRGKLVIASRERIPHDATAPTVRRLHLEGLDDDAVLALCEAKGVDVPPESVHRLREEVGGHPLALNLFLEAARARDGEVASLLDRVPERDLEAYLLQEVHDALDEDERTVLSHASLFRVPFGVEDLAALTPRNPRGVLLRLRRRLLVEDVDGAFAVHEVLRNFFRQLLHDPGELHGKLAARYEAGATVEDHLEAIHHHLEAGRRDRVLALLRRNLDLRDLDVVDAGYHAFYDEVLAGFTREEVGEDDRWAILLDERGDIRVHQGRWAEALSFYEQADALLRSAGNADHAGDLAWKRALALKHLDRRSEARELCDRALEEGTGSDGDRERLEALRKELG